MYGESEVKGRNKLDYAIAVVSILMILYHMVSAKFLILDPILHQNAHFMFGLTIVFLSAIRFAPKYRILWIAMLILGLASTGYVHGLFDDLSLRQGSPTDVDLVIGVLLVFVAVVATWKSWGAAIPILAIFFIFYALTADMWPGSFAGNRPPVDRFISQLSIGLTGMYGQLLGTSANYIFLFMVYGAVMYISGVTQWFNDVGKLAGKFSRGGPAQTAVISSCLVGMSSGSAAANVGIVGNFTIPLMKSVGFSPEKAGAIEAAASSGGQIMPPVMGATAFLIADMLGVTYLDVITWAITPALMYYFSIFIDVEFTARRENFKHVVQAIEWKEFALRLPLFVIPVGLLISMMMRGYSANYAALIAILSTLVLSYLRKETRPTWNKLVDACVSGAKSGAEIAVVTAALSPIWVTMTVTGLGFKLPAMIADLSGGNILLATFLVAIVSIILGMGVPTMAAYLMIAIVAGPALVDMGVVAPAAHLSFLYFAVFSAMTPPFAISALIASRIAGGNFFKTGWMAFFIGFFKLILPFLFVFNPQILLIDFHWKSGSLTLLALILCITFATAAKNRYFIGHLTWFEIAVAVAAVLLYGLFIVKLNYPFLVAGLALTIFVVISNLVRSAKRAKLNLNT